MKEKKALVLFSGGLDSTLTTCKMIESDYKVTLVHYDNGCSSGTENVLVMAQRLIDRYGKKSVDFWGTGMIIGYFKVLSSSEILSDPAQLVQKYPHLTMQQFTCLACRSAMYVYSILLCQKLGISVVAEGARKSQLFALEQEKMILKYKKLLKKFQIKLVTPLLTLETDKDREIELMIRGIIPKNYESQCWLGTPMEKALTSKQERDVLKIFDDEIKPKCLKLIKMSKKIDLDPRGKMF